MMMTVVLLGRLTRDFDLRQTQSGKEVASNSIACERRVKDSQGNWTKIAEFIPFSLWGETAKNAKKFTKKGSIVCLTGHLESKKEEKDNEKTRYWIEFFCENIQYVFTERDGEKDYPDEKERKPWDKPPHAPKEESSGGGVPF